MSDYNIALAKCAREWGATPIEVTAMQLSASERVKFYEDHLNAEMRGFHGTPEISVEDPKERFQKKVFYLTLYRAIREVGLETIGKAMSSKVFQELGYTVEESQDLAEKQVCDELEEVGSGFPEVLETIAKVHAEEGGYEPSREELDAYIAQYPLRKQRVRDKFKEFDANLPVGKRINSTYIALFAKYIVTGLDHEGIKKEVEENFAKTQAEYFGGKGHKYWMEHNLALQKDLVRALVKVFNIVPEKDDKRDLFSELGLPGLPCFTVYDQDMELEFEANYVEKHYGLFVKIRSDTRRLEEIQGSLGGQGFDALYVSDGCLEAMLLQRDSVDPLDFARRIKSAYSEPSELSDDDVTKVMACDALIKDVADEE